MKRKLITLPPETQADLLSLGLLSLLPLIFFWPETLGWRTLGDQDAVFWFFPAYRFVAQQLAAGRLPLWNPDYYSGVPLFAQWQAGVFDPLNLVHLCGPTSRSLTLALQLGFALALVSMWGYARAIGLGRRAGMVAAIVYSLSGFAVARTLYPGFLHIYALAPLVLMMTERLFRYGRWRDLLGGALVVAWQVAAAHPQPLIYSSLLAVAYAIFCVLARRDAVVARGWFLVRFGAMFLLGAGLMAIQLLPAAEIAGRSVRKEWPYEMFTLHSIHPASLLTAVIPYFHGGGRGEYTLPYWGISWHHNESQIYLGCLALALALGGAVLAARRREPTGIFWSGVATLGLLLVMGKYVEPLARILYHLPVINHFRSPNRYWLVVALAVAVLAGYAVDRMLKEPPPARRILAATTQIAAWLLLVVVAAIASLVRFNRGWMEGWLRSLPDWSSLPAGFLATAHLEMVVPVGLALAAALFLAGWTRVERRELWFPALLALLLLDYHLYARNAPITHAAGLENRLGGAVNGGPESPDSPGTPSGRAHLHLSPANGEFSPYWFAGQPMVTGYDPLLDGRYKNFTGIDEAGRSWLSSILQPRDRTLDLLGTRHLYLPPDWSPPASAPICPVELPPDQSLHGIAAGTGDLLLIELEPTTSRIAIRLDCASRNLLTTDGANFGPWRLTENCPSPPVLTILNAGQTPVKVKGAWLTNSSGRVSFNQVDSQVQPDPSRWREVGHLAPDSPYAAYRVFENRQPLPRAWLVSRVREAWDGDQLKLIRGELRDRSGALVDFRATALVDVPPRRDRLWYQDFLDNGRVPAADPGTARVVSSQSDRPDRLVVEAEATRPAILVVGEIADPGWKVEVDGQPAEWHRVNYALRGVPLPAGTHRVEFIYLPTMVSRGAMISLLTALGMVIAAVIASVAGRRSRGARDAVA